MSYQKPSDGQTISDDKKWQLNKENTKQEKIQIEQHEPYYNNVYKLG